MTFFFVLIFLILLGIDSVILFEAFVIGSNHKSSITHSYLSTNQISHLVENELQMASKNVSLFIANSLIKKVVPLL